MSMDPIIAAHQGLDVVSAFWGGLSVGGRVGAVLVALVLYVFSAGAAYGRWISRWPRVGARHEDGHGYSYSQCEGTAKCWNCQVNAGAAAIVWPVVGTVRLLYFCLLTPIGRVVAALAKAGASVARSGARLTAAPPSINTEG